MGFFWFFFNKYVLDGSSACESCQPIWSWTGGTVNLKHWKQLGPHRRKRPRKQLITWWKRIVAQDKAADYLIKTKLKILSASSRTIRSHWMANIYPTTTLGDYLNWKWSWNSFSAKDHFFGEGQEVESEEGWVRVCLYFWICQPSVFLRSQWELTLHLPLLILTTGLKSSLQSS